MKRILLWTSLVLCIWFCIFEHVEVHATKRRRAQSKKVTTNENAKQFTVSLSSLASNGCPGEPCPSTIYCRSQWGYCGGNSQSGQSDPWCNEKSTWKAGGCVPETTTDSPTLLTTTKSPTSKTSTTGTPTSKTPTSKSPTTQKPTTRQPTKTVPTTITSSPTKVVTKEPTTTRSPTTKSPTSKAPTTGNDGGACAGEPCDSATYCRSEWGYCGGDVNGPSDAYCNDKSTWKSIGCGTGTTITKSPSQPPSSNPPTTRAPTNKSPTSKSPTSKSPTSKSPTSKSPTTVKPTTVTPTKGSLETRSPTNTPTTGNTGGLCTGEPCEIATYCRSEWGYCGGNVNGPDDDYCNTKSTWKSTGCGGNPTSRSPTQMPVPTAPTPPTTQTPTNSIDELVADAINRKALQISSTLLLSQTPQGNWVPSTMYTAGDLEKAVRTASVDYAGLRLISTGIQGKLNVAAFIAQAQKESIAYDVCDENNWDLVNGLYPASNACGQLGQSYQDYTCYGGEKVMECPLDSNMVAQAKTNAKWFGAPAPLSAGPKSLTGTYTPAWNPYAPCPNEVCSVYPGQQGGAWQAGPAANRAGRTDTENCVWWGRGAIQLTGRCNIGKFNHFLGKGAVDRGVTNVPYPDIDFCKDPSAICHSTKYPDIKFVASFFYWMRDVQEYNVNGWSFRTQLANLAADHSNSAKRKAFIDGVSGIVNRGSHTITADGQAERAANFEKAYNVLFS